MKNFLPYLTIVLLIVIFILEERNDRLEKEKNLKTQNDLKLKLDSIEGQLRRSIVERDSFYLIADSLLFHSTSIKSQLDEANKKLKNIPGRYEYVPQDSLGLIMDRRADARR